jgi:hypothetical protein
VVKVDNLWLPQAISVDDVQACLRALVANAAERRSERPAFGRSCRKTNSNCLRSEREAPAAHVPSKPLAPLPWLGVHSQCTWCALAAGAVRSGLAENTGLDSGFGIRFYRMTRELTLRIVVEAPPSGVDFALQKGKGSAYEPVQKQRSKGNDLIFEFQPVIRSGVYSNGISLTGPFVQGPPRQRFVYVDIGTYAGQSDSQWSRRLKVPLEGITAELAAKGGVLEVRVPGTGRDGSPNCATVKDLKGWRAVRR